MYTIKDSILSEDYVSQGCLTLEKSNIKHGKLVLDYK